MTIRRATSRAIILRGDTLLVFERWRRVNNGQTMHYYSIPGGGIESGESPEDAVVREFQEEMGVIIRPDRLLVRQLTPQRYHSYYLCTLLEGEPKFQSTSQEAKRVNTGNRYKVAWLSIEDLLEQNMIPDYHKTLRAIQDNSLLQKHLQPVDITS